MSVVPIIRYSLCFYLYLIKKTLDYIGLIGVSPKLQPNLFVSSTCSKHWVILHCLMSVVPIIRYSLCFYLYLIKKTLDYIGLIGVSPKLQTNLFVSSTCSKHWVMLHCLMSVVPIIRYSLCFYLYLIKKTLDYIGLIGVSPKLQTNLFVSSTCSKHWVILHS